ncbi:hypothetical protein TrST_g10227 [Triparma strigata]|uniref:EGF-like domain-containing protein n=1 Tax=Triparma strigata TaxID=1606541 RepID=A0A9W7AQ22_9STRA|nr:hypothetical protein TrST_g10227 [Triparma strigata]
MSRRLNGATSTTANDENDIEIGIVSNPITNKNDDDQTEQSVKSENFRDKSGESFETIANRSAEGTAEAVTRGRGVSAVDAFQTSSAATGGFLHGRGSLQEMLTIAINFLQSFSLVTLLRINWPPWFKRLFGWMEMFMLDFEFIGGAKWVVIMCGLAIIPILVLESDHGLFRTGLFKRKDYQSVKKWVGDNDEWKKMTRTNLHDLFLFTFGFTLFLCLKAVSEGKLPTAWWIEGESVLGWSAIIIIIYSSIILCVRPIGRARMLLFFSTAISCTVNVGYWFYWIYESRLEYFPFSFWLGLLSLIFGWNIVNVLRWWGLRSLHNTCAKSGEDFTFKQIFSEHFAFLFIYTVVFLPGINSCIEIAKIGACWRAHEVMVEEKFVPSATSYNIILSGSSQGTCYVNGNCFGTGSTSGTYNNNERCTFTFSDTAAFAVGRFNTESGWDKLTVGGVEYDGTSGPSDGSVTAGEQFTWTSSDLYNRPGFEICTGDPCVASISSSDDGSNGTFYCVNGGSVGGIPGACSCSSCNMGFSGPSCESCTKNPTVITIGIVLGCVYSVVPLWLLWRTAKTVKASYASGDDYLSEIRAMSQRSQEEADRGSVTSELDVSATESYKAAVVGVILGSFEENYWWWKVWLLIERAALAVVVLIGVDPIAATTIVLIGWLTSLYARPYWDNTEDIVDLVSRTSTLFTVVAATLIHQKVVSGKEVWLEFILCFSGITTIIILVYAIGPLRVFRGAELYIRRKIRWRKILRCVAKGDVSDLSDEDVAQISMPEFAKFPLTIKKSLTIGHKRFLPFLKADMKMSEIDDCNILLKCAKDMGKAEGTVIITLATGKVVVKEGKATSIDWRGQGFTGILPMAVNKLTELAELDLRGNWIDGEDTEELSELRERLGEGFKIDSPRDRAILVRCAEEMGKSSEWLRRDKDWGCKGTTFDPRTGKIIKINWHHCGLTGSLPTAALHDLPSLCFLNLRCNPEIEMEENEELTRLKSKLGSRFQTGTAYTFANDELHAAVDMWCNHREAALREYGDIAWDVSKVTDMSGMFLGARKFDRKTIKNWDLRGKNTDEMFAR